tara:strand:- start:368 stop:493 length:126 start_codon:yes stop_codon:yes gene_type:complete
MEDKIRKILMEEFDNLKRQVPWNGMYDSAVDKIVKLFEDNR